MPLEKQPTFVFWRTATPHGTSATGSMRGTAVTLDGDLGTAFYLANNYPGFASAAFTPSLPQTGMLELFSHPGSHFTLTFETPVTDPILLLGSLGSTLSFAAGTTLQRLSGDDSFTVDGTSVIGDSHVDVAAGLTIDANGTVQLRGTFETLSFTAEPRGPVPERGDGVFLQLGGFLPTRKIRRNIIGWADRAHLHNGPTQLPAPEASGAPDGRATALFADQTLTFTGWHPTVYEGLAQLLDTVTSGDEVSAATLAEANVVAFELNGTAPASSGGWESCQLELRDSRHSVTIPWSEATVDDTFLGQPVRRDKHVLANGSISGDRYAAFFGIPTRVLTEGQPTLNPAEIVVSFLLLRVDGQVDVTDPAFRLTATGVPRTVHEPNATPDIDAVGVLRSDDTDLPLIGRIVLDPPVARVAEPVLIEVRDPDDHVMDPTRVQVAVNGVTGATQHLQFGSPGVRRIMVEAHTDDGRTDTRTALLDVGGQPATIPGADGEPEPAILSVTPDSSRAYHAVLTLGTGAAADARSAGAPVGDPPVLHVAPVDFEPGSLPARLETRGALARTMATHPELLVRTETTRLSGAGSLLGTLRQRAARRLATSSSRGTLRRGQPVPAARARRAVAKVFDLTTVDLPNLMLRPSGLDEFAPSPRPGRTPPATPQFVWDFGDGQTATTNTATVTHDYFAAMDHSIPSTQFVVTCHATHVDVVARRSLTVYSAYAVCKQVGHTIVPHVEGDVYAHKRLNRLSAAFTVFNVEDQPLTLDRMSVTAVNDDAADPTLPAPFVPLSQPVTVPARSQSVIGVNVPFVDGTPTVGQLRFDVTGFSVLYGGTCGETPVRCAVTFDVPVREWAWPPTLPRIPEIFGDDVTWPWPLVDDAFTGALAREAIHPQHASVDPDTGTFAVPVGSLGQPGGIGAVRAGASLKARAGRVLESMFAPVEEVALRPRDAHPGRRRPAADAVARDIHGGARIREGGRVFDASALTIARALFAEGPPAPGAIAEGEVCDPDNLTEAELAAAAVGQLVCQLTEETHEVRMPARWMNARKGDCILSPGGDGIIGGLMLNVQPPQWYSHSGIMTRNYDEIAHSTGSARRLLDHQIGFTSPGSDGFEPRVLKYIWPGAVVQTVENSIVGEVFPDPEYAETYHISAFGPRQVGITHGEHMKMIPPLVLKPDPAQETPEVRATLHRIADAARRDAGRPGVKGAYHYRWFCYTDPTIGLGPAEGPEAGWAQGTRPSVCSAYIWMHAKAEGAHLETSQAVVSPGDLEPSDIAGGALIRPTTPDGLYTYTAQERRDAANWLYSYVYNQAYEKAGWFGNFLTDAADDIANQFLNAFANDDADGKDSDAWRDVTAADAVSPDDMLWWDSPAGGGVYGYSEPAIYREARTETYTVSRWKRVITHGTVHGTVTTGSGPIAGAFVQLYDGKTTFTDAQGHYSLGDVPFGDYLLKSSKVLGGVLVSAQRPVHVDAADVLADVALQEPDERYRLAQIFIDFRGRDEETFGSDEILDPGPEYLELDLGPDRPTNSFTRTYKWGGEVRVEYQVTLRLLVGNIIDTQVKGQLYEGTSEDTDDLDGWGEVSLQSTVNQTTAATLTITNTEEDADDSGMLSISVKNVRNNN